MAWAAVCFVFSIKQLLHRHVHSTLWYQQTTVYHGQQCSQSRARLFACSWWVSLPVGCWWLNLVENSLHVSRNINSSSKTDQWTDICKCLLIISVLPERSHHSLHAHFLREKLSVTVLLNVFCSSWLLFIHRFSMCSIPSFQARESHLWSTERALTQPTCSEKVDSHHDGLQGWATAESIYLSKWETTINFAL